MGEGLKADEARDAAFLLTGAGMRVGKSAYLTTDPMTIQEGRRAIAQAVLNNRVKARDQDVPKLICQPNNLSSLIPLGPLHLEMCLYFAVLTTKEHPDSLLEVKGIIGGKGTSDLGHPSFLPLPQTVVLKVIEVQYPRCLHSHLNWTAQMGPDVLGKEGGIAKKCI